MRSAVFLLTFCAVSALSAQTSPPFASADRSGVAAEWDVRSYMTTMAADIRKLEPLIKQIDPSDWVSKGAPDSYVRQLQSSQFSLQNLINASDKLAKDPERLSSAFDVYFEMERMELLLNSLREGVRRYQSPDLADALGRQYAQNVVHRDRLRTHIRDLSSTREQEFDIVRQEAQRCRNELYQVQRQAPKPQTRKKQ